MYLIFYSTLREQAIAQTCLFLISVYCLLLGWVREQVEVVCRNFRTTTIRGEDGTERGTDNAKGGTVNAKTGTVTGTVQYRKLSRGVKMNVDTQLNR